MANSRKDQPRGQPANAGQFSSKPKVQASTPEAPAVDLGGQAGRDRSAVREQGSEHLPGRSGLWPVPVEDTIPSSIAEFVERLRNAAASLDQIASDSRLSGAGVVDAALAIEDRRAQSDSFRSLYHTAAIMSDEGVCDIPPVMSAHNPLAPMIDPDELREWASNIEDGASWARRAALRLSNQADYTDALLGADAAKAV